MNKLEFFRRRYEAIAKAYEGKGLVIAPSKLRVEVPLVSGVGNYNFPIVDDTQSSDSRRTFLNRNDLLVVNSMMLYIAFKEGDKTLSASPLYTYPILVRDPSSDNDTGNYEGFLSHDAEAIYNGILNWKVGQTTILESFGTENFRVVPETQPIPFIGATSTQLDVLRAQFNTGMAYTPAANIIVAGNISQSVKLEFDAAGLDFSASTIQGEATPYLVFYLDGFLVKEGTVADPNSAILKGAIGQLL